MTYCGPLLAVRDMAVSRKFYEELLGLVLELDYGRNIAYRCGLSLQQDMGWLLQMEEPVLPVTNMDHELYFEEEDLDSLLKKLDQAGVKLLHPLREHPWGQRGIRFCDPDGHIIEVGEPMPAVVRRLRAQGMPRDEVARITMQPLESVPE